MRIFTTSFAALLISGAVTIAAIQPQRPGNQPGSRSGKQPGAQPQQQQGGRPQAQSQGGRPQTQSQGGQPQAQSQGGQGGRPQAQSQGGQGGRPQAQSQGGQGGQGGQPQAQSQGGQGGRPQAQSQGGVRSLQNGLPPAPRIQPQVQQRPFGPQAQNWLPLLNPPPFQRGPIWPLRIPIEIAPVAQVPDLEGIWYHSGDPGKPARIVQRRLDGRALFINENGSQAWGSVGGSMVYIPDWSDGFQQGLVGTIRGDRIIWPDGNFWSRTPFGGWFWDR